MRSPFPSAVTAVTAVAVATAALTALTLTAPPASAVTTTAPAGAAALPGYVCFWPEPGETGPGGGWCYNPTPGGFAEPEARVLRHAKSFASQVDKTVYALHFPGQGPCLQRTIHGGDWSGNWEWWNRLDAVDTNRHADCEAG
ncbi:hypothetical protein ACFQVC_02450 [Streptomyces monticola]|uniref:Peptidase inhibitor family I36 protein n=1 Tax=Streptomyces monticola TaxID=2666263 RepID=A0ABW2JCJ1_9ACTN